MQLLASSWLSRVSIIASGRRGSSRVTENGPVDNTSASDLRRWARRAAYSMHQKAVDMTEPDAAHRACSSKLVHAHLQILMRLPARTCRLYIKAALRHRRRRNAVMPQACSVECSDDLASTDEVKVYKDEGDDEKRSSEILSEEKFGLVIETEDVRRCASWLMLLVESVSMMLLKLKLHLWIVVEEIQAQSELNQGRRNEK